MLNYEEEVLLTAYYALVVAEPPTSYEPMPTGYIEALSHLSRAAGRTHTSRRVKRLDRAPSNKSRKFKASKAA